MRVYKHKNIEYSEVNLSDLERTMRVDAEFYEPVHIEVEEKLSNYTLLKLPQIVSVSDGNHFKISDDFIEEGIPYYRGQDTTGNYFIELSSPNKIDFDTFNQGFMKRSHLRKGDILLSIVGTVGNVSLVTSEQDATCSCKLAILRPFKISSEFLFTFLQCHYGNSQIKKFARGALQTGFILADCPQIKVPKVSDKFQLLIQGLIQKAQQQKELSDKLYKEAEEILLEELGLLHWKPKTKKFKLQGVQFEVEDTINEVNTLQVLSSDRVDSEYWLPKYEEFNNKLLINKHIEFNPLASYFTWAKGIEVGSKEYVEESKYPFIRVSNISKNGFNFQSAKYIHEETYKKLKPFHLRKGEILFSKDGTAGIALLVRENIEAITSSGILRLTNISNLPSEYFELVLNSQIVQIQIAQKISGALIHHLKVTEAMKFIIPEIKSIARVAELVNKSNHNKVSSTTNINNAIKAVELFIEEGEAAAVKFIKQKSN